MLFRVNVAVSKKQRKQKGRFNFYLLWFTSSSISLSVSLRDPKTLNTTQLSLFMLGRHAKGSFLWSAGSFAGVKMTRRGAQRWAGMGSVRWGFRCGSWTPSRSEWLFAARCVQQEEKDRIGQFVFAKDAKSAMVSLICNVYPPSAAVIPVSMHERKLICRLINFYTVIEVGKCTLTE